MAIRPKWLKDICSVAFSVYYLVWASDGDEVVGRDSRLLPISTDIPATTLPSAVYRRDAACHLGEDPKSLREITSP